MLTERQQRWLNAADKAERQGNDLAAGLFTLIAQPNHEEQGGHDCREHSVGFRREGRRGFKCGFCKTILRWVD